jgi:predicted ester cyclase
MAAKNHEKLLRMANYELFDRRNFKVIPDLFSTEYVVHSGSKKFHGHNFIKRIIKQLHSAIPNIRVVDIRFLMHEGRTVAWQRTLNGTHKEKMMGIPPSGKKIIWREMVTSRFNEKNKIEEEWMVSELLGTLLSKQ